MTMPASLQRLISNEPDTNVQLLVFALYDLIASLTAGTVVGPGVSVNNDIAVFDGVTGQVLKDGAQTIAQVIAAAVAASGNVTGPAGAVADDVVSFNGATGLLVKDSGKLVTAIATGPASAVSGDLPSFNGTGGKTLQDSGVLASNVVQGPGSVTANNLAVFNGTSGKLVKDGGAPSSGGLVQYAEAIRTAGDLTISATSMTDLTGMSVTITTGAHRCIVNALIIGTTGLTAQSALFATLTVDGVDQASSADGMTVLVASLSMTGPLGFMFMTGVLSAGSHTFKLQAKRSTSNGVIYGTATNGILTIGVTETNLTT